jgi:hypothetical protein
LTRKTTYFAAFSDTNLESVCSGLQSRFALPHFEFDSHDSWRYAIARTPAIGFNVTRADDARTIENWMGDCPTGVNFQIIADYDVEPIDLVTVLRNLLKANPIRYYTKQI